MTIQTEVSDDVRDQVLRYARCTTGSYKASTIARLACLPEAWAEAALERLESQELVRRRPDGLWETLDTAPPAADEDPRENGDGGRYIRTVCIHCGVSDPGRRRKDGLWEATLPGRFGAGAEDFVCEQCWNQGKRFRGQAVATVAEFEAREQQYSPDDKQLIQPGSYRPDYPSTNLRTIPLRQISESPLNPRQTFDELEITSLAASLKSHGLIEPLVVRRRGVPTAYELIAGARRLRAARLAGLEQVPAIIREDVDDTQARLLMLAENGERENLNPLDLSDAYQALAESGMTQGQIAKAVNRSQPHVSGLLSLQGLPEDVRQLVRDGKLTQRQGAALARLSQWPAVQSEIGQIVLKYGAGDLEHSPLPHAHIVSQSGLIKPLDVWTARFDTRVCKECPFGAKRGSWCLKPDHWQELQDAAISAREVETREINARRHGLQPEGDTPRIEPEPVAIGTDPEVDAYNDRARAQAAEREAEIRRRHEEYEQAQSARRAERQELLSRALAHRSPRALVALGVLHALYECSPESILAEMQARGMPVEEWEQIEPGDVTSYLTMLSSWGPDIATLPGAVLIRDMVAQADNPGADASDDDALAWYIEQPADGPRAGTWAAYERELLTGPGKSAAAEIPAGDVEAHAGYTRIASLPEECKSGCEHKEHVQARNRADALCSVCGKRIGIERRYRMAHSGPVHATCDPESVAREAAQP